MKLAAMLTLFATAAYAADPAPADAPTVTGLVELEAGQAAPVKLSCLPDAEYIASEQAAREDHVIAKAVRPNSGYTILPTWGVVALVAGALAAGAAITAGGIALSNATKKPGP